MMFCSTNNVLIEHTVHLLIAVVFTSIGWPLGDQLGAISSRSIGAHLFFVVSYAGSIVSIYAVLSLHMKLHHWLAFHCTYMNTVRICMIGIANSRHFIGGFE